jgi:hypothetical protein
MKAAFRIACSPASLAGALLQEGLLRGHRGAMEDNRTVHYRLTDHLGSPSVAHNAGECVSTLRYLDWGKGHSANTPTSDLQPLHNPRAREYNRTARRQSGAANLWPPFPRHDAQPYKEVDICQRLLDPHPPPGAP